MEEKRPRKTDRRTLYTRQIIKDNFVALLDGGTPVEKITVSELCRLSELNRCTFYLHFPDIYGVLEELQETVQSSMTQCVYASLTDAKERQDICAILFASIRENPVFQTLYRHNLTTAIMRRVCEYSKSLLINLCVETKQFTQREAELFALFLINGCVAVSEDQVMNHWDSFERDNNFVTKILDRLYAMLDIGAINQAFRKNIDGSARPANEKQMESNR